MSIRALLVALAEVVLTSLGMAQVRVAAPDSGSLVRVTVSDKGSTHRTTGILTTQDADSIALLVQLPARGDSEAQPPARLVRFPDRRSPAGNSAPDVAQRRHGCADRQWCRHGDWNSRRHFRGVQLDGRGRYLLRQWSRTQYGSHAGLERTRCRIGSPYRVDEQS
jgi:hypothetical protein